MAGEHPGPELRASAEILFTATVKADELRFHEVPESSVEFSGDADGSSTSGSVRTNLPDEVETNVTYRDVRIDYAIAAKLAEPDDDDRP
ncbi:hypothetical protein [Actinomadura viridis]|uniref:Uncharacterized protein n=1 Tax=Actinomadura viridis TaxID=58110 RepID=A0A931GMQ3_9ACTN|nr:hypothetical protein [Actinomadura viridis]MBG6092225.1 hypothetical protein [Actinomadura viridis]